MRAKTDQSLRKTSSLLRVGSFCYLWIKILGRASDLLRHIYNVLQIYTNGDGFNCQGLGGLDSVWLNH